MYKTKADMLSMSAYMVSQLPLRAYTIGLDRYPSDNGNSVGKIFQERIKKNIGNY